MLQLIRRLKNRGTAVVLISHKLDDLYDCCDRAVVMRAGRVVGLSNLKQEDRAELVRLIVGAELPPPDTRHGLRGAPRVSVKDLVIHRQNGTVAVDRVSFDLHAGEIIGLCGVEGNGQTELLQALAGMHPLRSGEVTYTLEQSIVNADAATLGRSGVAHIPEDRLQYALISSFNLTRNWLLRKLGNQRFVTWGLLRLQAAAKATARAIEANDVRASGPRARAADLSGGKSTEVRYWPRA